MNKIIKITTGNEVLACDFPDGMSSSEANNHIYSLIGNGCDIYQTVYLDRLYEDFYATKEITDVPGEAVVALVDEEGLFRNLEINKIGSYLYKTDVHGEVIVGTVLIAGLGWSSEEEGIRFMGISDNTFDILYSQLQDLGEIVRKVDKR